MWSPETTSKNGAVPKSQMSRKILQIKHMKKIFIFLIAVVGFNNSFAQDYITLKNGDEIKAKVLEVNTDLIKYKNWTNLEGPIYSIAKGDVFMIKYANGTKDVFKITSAIESNTPNIPPVEKNRTTNSDKNIVVKSDDDWEKVILTQTASEVEGLIKKGELKESTFSLGVILPSQKKKVENKLRMKIQKDAAKIGAHIVLITPMVEGSTYDLRGMAYGYK